MEKEHINKERTYGKVEMIIHLIACNEVKMNKIGFGYELPWEKIALCLDGGEDELEQIRTMCYLFSKRGVRDTVISDISRGKQKYEVLSDKKQTLEVSKNKLLEHIEYAKANYPYPEDIIQKALDKEFALSIGLDISELFLNQEEEN